MIKYIKNRDLDRERWNECIRNAAHPLIYAEDWYLDIVAKQWDALILEDYEAVMPITWNKKLGFYYMYQPYFMQQGGIFGKKQENGHLVKVFLQKIPSRFKLVEISLNESNGLNAKGFRAKISKNYVLHLNKPYPEILDGYSPSHKRSVDKGRKARLTATREVDHKKMLRYLQDLMRDKVKKIGTKELKIQQRLIETAIAKGWGYWIAAIDENNSYNAGIFLLEKHNRLINLFTFTAGPGREHGAMHFLMDRVMQQCAGSNLVYDFEGSDIHSIAKFYKSFGAIPNEYLRIRKNNLPGIVKWMKQ